MRAASIPIARQGGASRLELAVTLLIVLMLSAWLLHTLRFYQELTEKVVVESTIVNLRSGLRFRIADLLLNGEGARQSELAASNPVNYADVPPRGYLGEMRKPGKLPEGSWYYEQDKAELVYIPALRSNLALDAVGAGEEARLRWQIRVVSGEAGVAAVDIQLLTPYRWF